MFFFSTMIISDLLASMIWSVCIEEESHIILYTLLFSIQLVTRILFSFRVKTIISYIPPNVPFPNAVMRAFKLSCVNLIDAKTALQIYNAMIFSILTYCPFTTCGSIPPSLEGRIDALESRAQKIIGNSSIIPSSTTIRRERVATFVHRYINNDVCENFENYSELNQSCINTRNNGIMIRIPRVRLEVARSLFYSQGAVTFNNLPREWRMEKNISKFKSYLNTL